MNKAAFILGLWLATVGICPAQVTVEVVFEQEQFLRNESLPLKVRISNSSGQTLRLGREPDWLSFEITDGAGRAVRREGQVPLAEPFILPSAKVANLQTDLMPYFDLKEVGQYSVAVAVKIPQLEQTFSAPPKIFNIISGTKLWEREFGVPSRGVPEVRKYALQQATFLKQLRIYARLTDPSEKKVFRVVPLGSLMSFSKPEAQLDKSCNLHVLFQASARGFAYQVVGPDGELIIRQTYEYTESRPVLRLGEEGGVSVEGGRRRVMRTDLPPPPEPEPVPVEIPATNEPPKNVPTKAKK